MTTDATFSVTGADEVRLFLDKLPDYLFEAAKSSISEAVFGTHEAVLRNLQGSPMQSRSGSLGRSILPEVTGDSLDSLVGRVYSTIKYARIQELGGTVTAKDKYSWLPGGPYLNIPTKDNKTPAGVMRMTAQMVFAAGGGVKSTPDGFGLYLGMTKMFTFAKKVTLKPRLGMRAAADDQIPPLLLRLDELLQTSLNS